MHRNQNFGGQTFRLWVCAPSPPLLLRRLCAYQSEGVELGESFAQRLAASLHDVAQVLDVELLLSYQRRHLGRLVVGVLVDDAHRADDRPTTQTEIVASLGRMLLAVQRVGQPR